MEHEFEGKKIAVTGVTGFIGGHLARRLQALGAKVRAAGRKLDRARDVLDAGARPIPFDLTDPTTFAAVVEGQDVVYHVAAWMSRGDPSLARPINVDATAGLVQAAAGAGVKRFVLVSTVATYGTPHTDTVVESHPLDPEQKDRYGRTKAQGEAAALQAQRGDLELVIVRPAMVYGPGSAPWSRGMLKLVKGGTPVLFGPAHGYAFPVYIDNLIDALVQAGTVDEAAGEAFHIADGPVTWEQWFESFGAMCNRSPRRIPLWAASGLALAAEILPSLGIPLTREYLQLYRRPIVFDTAKARRLLGWQPAVDYDEGQRRAEAWLREVGAL